MTITKAHQWFQELGRIWLEKDIVALRHIVADEFQYYEDPFQPPITTWEELEAVWQEVHDQHIESLSIEILIEDDVRGLARYEFVCTDPVGTKHHSRGAHYVKLDEKGRAIEFRQWWTTKTC